MSDAREPRDRSNDRASREARNPSHGDRAEARGTAAENRWPAWAVVNWERLEGGASSGNGLRDPVSSADGRQAVPEPAEPAEHGQAGAPIDSADDRAEERDPGEFGSVKARLRPELMPWRGSALMIPPDRLAELLQQTANAAQAARERAARAEGQARALQQELYRERVERQRLEAQLVRKRWFRRKSLPPS
jgi:hypothetical protein